MPRKKGLFDLFLGIMKDSVPFSQATQIWVELLLSEELICVAYSALDVVGGGKTGFCLPSVILE